MPKIENFIPNHLIAQATESQINNVVKNYESAPKIHSSNYEISDDNICYLKYEISDGETKQLFYITRIDSNPNLFFNEGLLVHANGDYQRACLNLFGVINDGGDLQNLDLDFTPTSVREIAATLNNRIHND